MADHYRPAPELVDPPQDPQRRRHSLCILAERGDGLHHGCDCHQTSNVALGFECTCPTAQTTADELRRLARILRAASPTTYAYAAQLLMSSTADELERTTQDQEA